MRLGIMIIVGLVAGCSRTAPDAPQTESSGTSVITSPQPKLAPPTGLYSDEEIRKLAPFDLDKEAGAFGLPFDVHVLDVVPEGESYPRERVFKTLGIDATRVRDFRKSGINFVVFLTWQVSPSYDISCMTATNDPENNELEMTDPKRLVYGIRLVKRPE
ncbi:Uncharacterized protein OS=Leptospira interrogans serovar Manilae GN=CI00_07890 PE=4 SV=1 [Gemmata massiliana]|uniref:Uncharacterized protein n=1 Tax=Gemmata massiliana TaxID=1210884 RepID=A0A6P2D9I2_9BACT|nr:hypothetical protein [Gemmata massiliana]VTR97839.1 Uncharacterized protein OS=Leptospira interrogans serovar Manilae GN=CI00_07890 PE=4 SV=1 [Gemmata massiliana]